MMPSPATEDTPGLAFKFKSTDSGATMATSARGFDSKGRSVHARWKPDPAAHTDTRGVIIMTQPMRDTSAETLRFSHGDTALGTIIVAESVRGVTALFIGDDRMKLLRDLKDAFPSAEAVFDPAGLRPTIAGAVALVNAPHRGTDLQLDLRGSDIEVAVWNALQRTYLWRYCQRPADGRVSAGGGCRLRGEPYRRRRPLSSRRESRWLDFRVPLGRASQAPADQHGRSGAMELDLRMSRATDSAARAGSAITIEARVESVDWVNVHADLDAQGWAIAPKLLSGAEADFLSGLYHQEHCFRSRII